MFSQLTDSLESTLKNLRGQGKLTEENVAESLREVRRAFLEADVNFNVTRDFVKSVKEKALGSDVLLSVTPGQQIVKIIHDELVNTMGGETKEVSLTGQAPIGIMMVGLQGSGKTTFAGKIALYMRSKKKRKPLLVAADVYRPAAIKQLQVLGKSIGIPVYEEGQGNPVEIIKHGYEYAKENGYDLVIYDTAGRLQIDEELMVELEQASAAVKPNEIFFVADAMIGQEAVNVAETFFNRLNFTGVCLSKMDGDTRGGAALSIKKMTGVPICFVGLGEKLSDIDVFHPDRMANRILGMGDIVSLVERAQEVFDEKTALEMEKKMANRFVLNETSYHGKGAINEIATEIKARAFKKAFVCSDPDLIKFGVTTKVTDILDKAEIPYEIYSNIKPNPTIENVQTGVEAFKKSGADCIVAIGGGSSMDTAKAIGIIITNPEFADVRSLEGVAPTKNPCVPIIAVPTTAGTAAEVTINYVITDVEKDRKMVCVDVHDIPVVAVVDSEMMASMPKGLTAFTGMDALTHAIEGYTTRGAWELSDMFHFKAIQLISQKERPLVHSAKVYYLYGDVTDEQVEKEIERMKQTPEVKLAKKDEQIRYRRRQYLYCLRQYEKKGKALMEAGITMEMLEKMDNESED